MWKINVSERREKEENQGETEMFLETLKKIDFDGKKITVSARLVSAVDISEFNNWF